jgi:glutamine synthetase
MDQLPASCAESAERLRKDREIYQKDGVIPAGTIDAVIKGLESFGDENLREKLERNQGEVSRLVEKFLHWM